MDMYPLQVEVNEKNILKLQTLYKRATREIENELLTATDFGVANRQMLLAQINTILRRLAINTAGFIQEELPIYYDKGQKQALMQLNNVGAEVASGMGFNSINDEAIQALIDDTAKAFGESLTGVSRSATVLLGKVVREELTFRMAKGFIGGEALSETTKAMKAVIKDKGITALIDKGGHSWSLDRYTEMLFRTKAVEARNRGMINTLAQNNYDLVQVSNHNSDHDECRVWEGRILSVTGITKGYPTVAQAESEGLFHPNCKHAINVLIPSLARQTEAYNPDERTKVISKAEIEKATDIERGNLPK